MLKRHEIKVLLKAGHSQDGGRPAFRAYRFDPSSESRKKAEIERRR